MVITSLYLRSLGILVPFLQNHLRLFLLLIDSSRLCPANVHQQICPLATSGQVRHVGVGSQHLGNLPRRLNLSDLNQTIASLGNRLADGLCTLGFTLGADDVGLALLLGALDDEARTLGILLRNLLLLDSLGELLAKGHVGDGNILKRNVELGGALDEVGTDALRDSLALRDELGSVELGDDGLEYFVADGGEDTLVVVWAEVLWGFQLV